MKLIEISEIQYQAVKKFFRTWNEAASFFKLLVDQRLRNFHQLFSWISVESSKYLIDKLINSQSQKTLWLVSLVQHVTPKGSFKNIFFEIINYVIKYPN